MASLRRLLLISLLMTSAVLLVGAEEDPVDDVDRTDFSDPALQEDPIAKGPQGPHSEVEPASILPDITDGKVPIGVQSFVLASLANAGRKMFNVSKIMGSLQDGDGKEIQKLPTRVYGEPLGPLEQRSFLFGFTPDEKTPTGQYKLSLQILYNNRDKDQFNDTVFDEAIELVPAPPSYDAQLRLVQAGIGGAFVILVLVFLTSRGGSSTAEVSKAKKAKSPAGAAVQQDEWLSGTMAASEGSPGKKQRKPKRG